MKTYITLKLELNDEGCTIGEVLGITEERADEIGKKALEIASKSDSWAETYKELAANFTDNETLYLIGWLWFINGVNHGRTEALREVAETWKDGRAGQ